MDITDIVTTDFEEFDGDTRVAELEGHFHETGSKAVVVVEEGEYQGMITRQQVLNAHLDPDTKARNLIWNVARVDIRDDVRTVARLMVGSKSKVLPVFDDAGDLHGVIEASSLLEHVQPFLEVLTVEEVFTEELASVEPDVAIGKALHVLREEGITHLPVIEESAVKGIVSIFDMLEFTTRDMQRSQGGSPEEMAEPGTGKTRGGFGERSGDIERMLDLPVRNVMSDPVLTTDTDEDLDDAVATMLENDVSSLVVTDGDSPTGIVTMTDVLESLTWTAEPRMPVQVTGVELLDDISREEIAKMLESTVEKYGNMRVLEANVNMHEHKETRRGVPLLQARIRVFTDKGHFVGTGEGYGASHAIHVARNILERQILEGKEYGKSKKHPSEADVSKFLGWWLVGSQEEL